MTQSLTAEILRHALVVAAEEASIVVVRSAYSSFIVEGSDASAAILDPTGRLIAHSMATTLMNSMALSVALPELLADIPATSMRPGDVFAMNDAYRGGVHTNDILVFRPVFSGAEIAYFTGALIHVSDLGGLSAGGMAPLATEIFLEGLQLPPVRIASADGLEPAIVSILRLNSRTPDKVIGDVRALVAGVTVAAVRMEKLLAEHGTAALAQAVEDYLDDTEQRTRAALATLPARTFHAAYGIDDDGLGSAREHLVRVAVSPDGRGSIELDFTGTSPAVPAAINASVSQSLAAAVFAVRCFTDPTIPMNDGSLRPIVARFPPGSLLNATSPHPTGGRFVPIYAAMEAILQALSDAVPERAIAASGILQPFSIASCEAPYWIHLAYDFGGVGARRGKDGPDSTGVHFGVGRNSVPQIEPAEARCPFLIESIARIPDSGGPGRWRGGLGTQTVFRLREPAYVTTRGDRLTTPPPGRDGGRPGRVGGFFVERADGTTERLPSKINNLRLEPGEAFIVQTTGGGGIGDPMVRDPDQIRTDLAAGQITRIGAATDYGVPA